MVSFEKNIFLTLLIRQSMCVIHKIQIYHLGITQKFCLMKRIIKIFFFFSKLFIIFSVFEVSRNFVHCDLTTYYPFFTIIFEYLNIKCFIFFLFFLIDVFYFSFSANTVFVKYLLVKVVLLNKDVCPIHSKT